jgi:hypothetical protein
MIPDDVSHLAAALTGEVLAAPKDHDFGGGDGARALTNRPIPSVPIPAGPTPAGQAALETARALARQANAPATLRAYKADWTHYAAWCGAKDFVPVPADPKTVGAYLASLAETHAPTTIRRRLAAIGKMHRFNDLPWNAAHRDIQEPLQGLLRQYGRPVQKAAALGRVDSRDSETAWTVIQDCFLGGRLGFDGSFGVERRRLGPDFGVDYWPS